MKKFSIFFLISIIILSPIVLAEVFSVSIVNDYIFKDKSGKNWLISITGRSADFVRTFTKSELKKETGREPERAFTVKNDILSQKAVYGSKFKRTVWSVDLDEKDGGIMGMTSDEFKDFINGKDDGNACMDLDQNGKVDYVFLKNTVTGRYTHVYCFQKKDRLGSVWKTHLDYIDWDTKFTVNPEGRPAQSVTLSNQAGSDEKVTHSNKEILKGKVYVEWLGDFVTGIEPPDVNNAHIYAETREGNDYLTTDDKFDDWTDTLKNDGEYALSKYRNDEWTKSRAESELNDEANEIFAWNAGGKWDKNKVTFSDTTFEHDLTTKQASIPAFNLFIDGKYYVKIKRPAAKPSCAEISGPEKQEGSKTKTVRVCVENTADTEGKIETTLKCRRNSVQTPKRTLIFDAGEKKCFDYSVTLPVLTSEVTARCTVHAKDPTGRNPTSTCTDTWTGTPRPTCSPGEKAQRFDDPKCRSAWGIFKCNPDTGKLTTLVRCCEPGQTIVDVDGLKCSSGPDSDGDGVPDGVDRCPHKAGVPKYDGCPSPRPKKCSPINPLTWGNCVTNLWRGVTEKVTGILMWIGVGVVALIALGIIFMIIAGPRAAVGAARRVVKR